MVTPFELEQAADAVERWLSAQDAGDPELAEADVEDLWAVSGLAMAGAPEAEVADAVRRARQSGWSWLPIALLLGISRPEAKRRFGSPAGSPPPGPVGRIPVMRAPSDDAGLIISGG
jgi:hypothetical protein